jgi:hypothetical protein
MQSVITSTAEAGLGFNPLNVVRSVARTGARVVTDKRFQRAAAAGAAAYAPGQYSQAQEYADRVRGIIRPPQAQMVPDSGAMPDGSSDAGPPVGPPMGPPGAQHGNILMFGLIGAGILALLMFSKS